MLIAARTVGEKLLAVVMVAALAGPAGQCSSGPAQTTVTAPNQSMDSLPTIGLSANSLTFMATAGGTSPPAQTVMVTDSGGGTLSGLGIGAIGYTSGPTGWLAASESPPTAPGTVTVTAAVGSLPAGTYAATVWVVSSTPGVTNSPRTFGVTLVVSGS